MKYLLPLAALALIAAAPPGEGAISTVARGTFVCELPGSAAGLAGVPQPDRGFRIKSASRYTAPQGSGIYLRRGDVLNFTSGPRQGERYQVMSSTFLRLIEDGKPGPLRCIRARS